MKSKMEIIHYNICKDCSAKYRSGSAFKGRHTTVTGHNDWKRVSGINLQLVDLLAEILCKNAPDAHEFKTKVYEYLEAKKTTSEVMTTKRLTIDELLEEISVLSPGHWDNVGAPKDWYAVCDDTGIIAYFSQERLALNFRLNLINSRLNNLEVTL